MQKRKPFVKYLITSTHPRFHAMVVKRQPKTQNSNENKGVQKRNKKLHLKTHIPSKNLFQNLSLLDI
jgi:hypothetical protein